MKFLQLCATAVIFNDFFWNTDSVTCTAEIGPNKKFFFMFTLESSCCIQLGKLVDSTGLTRQREGRCLRIMKFKIAMMTTMPHCKDR